MNKSYIHRFGKLTSIVLIIFFSFLVYSIPNANAEENQTVDQCIKNPEECKSSNNPAAEPNKESAAVSLSGWDYIKMVLALIFVIALLYGVLRWLNRNNRSFQKNQLVKNLGGTTIGQQKSIQVVQIGSTLLVVGVGENISILKEVTDENEKEDILQSFEDIQDITTPIPYVSEILKKIPLKFPLTKFEQETKSESFGTMFQSKLDDMKKKRQQSLSNFSKTEKGDNER